MKVIKNRINGDYQLFLRTGKFSECTGTYWELLYKRKLIGRASVSSIDNAGILLKEEIIKEKDRCGVGSHHHFNNLLKNIPQIIKDAQNPEGKRNPMTKVSTRHYIGLVRQEVVREYFEKCKQEGKECIFS